MGAQVSGDASEVAVAALALASAGGLVLGVGAVADAENEKRADVREEAARMVGRADQQEANSLQTRPHRHSIQEEGHAWQCRSPSLHQEERGPFETVQAH